MLFVTSVSFTSVHEVMLLLTGLLTWQTAGITLAQSRRGEVLWLLSFHPSVSVYLIQFVTSHVL